MAAMGDEEALFALHAPPDIGTPAADTTGDTPTARIASATELLQARPARDLSWAFLHVFTRTAERTTRHTNRLGIC